jgi:glutamine synthetase
MAKTKEDILKLIDEAGVRYIRLCFTDVLGRLKGMALTRPEIEEALDSGQGFDGSSIEGFVRIEESDLMAVPDMRSFRIFPWLIGGERVAMMFCDIQTPEGEPYDGDPRYILRKVLKYIDEKRWTFYTGPEIEYFYFKNDQKPEIIDKGGYFDYGTVDIGTTLRKKTVHALESIGIPVECSHHEVAPSQQEIDLKYQDALVMADFAQLYKFIVKEIALENGYYATFMPKPLFGLNGSGMHTHMSIFENSHNLFFDGNDPYQLSELARHFAAGILKHIHEITLVTNQWVNSYKRLVAGFEAPVYISWGRRNRSSLLRVPMYRVGKEKATRIEIRSPDPACNPYLAFAVMLAAGLKGMEEKYELSEPIEQNIFHMTPAEREKLEIKSLPGTLEEAIIATEQSELVREIMGDQLFTKFIANKKVEWDQYRTCVTEYEVEKYMSML